MKSLFVLLLLSTSFPFIYAQKMDWVVSVGSSGSGNDVGRSIVADAMGNSYTVGVFEGVVDFDPGPGVQNLTSLGGDDVFILKLDALGNLIWVKSISGLDNQGVASIAMDNSGYLYITGGYKDTTDFDPGIGVYNQTGTNQSAYVAKYDLAGNLVWVNSFGGDHGNSVAIDQFGNVHVGGVFQNVADFDPGPGISNLISQGSFGGFVAKYDSSGNFLWVKGVDGNSTDVVRSISVDFSGNIYAVGFFAGTVDFNPSTTINNLTSAGSTDIFCWKLDSAGNFVWANRHGSNGADMPASICLDHEENPVITGHFKNVVDFDPGPGVLNLGTNATWVHMYIQKLDVNGNLKWASSIDGTSNEFPAGIVSDISGNIFTTGRIMGKAIVDFDPGLKTHYVTPKGNGDVFVLKQDSLGNFQRVKVFGGKKLDFVEDITLDPLGNILLTGQFSDTSNFDPGSSVHTITSNGGFDIFVSKLAPCAASYGIDSIAACDSLTWIDGVTYRSNTNSACYTLINAQGCDSLVSLNLTINHSSSGVDSVFACNSYTWIDGVTYYSDNNTATYRLTTQDGCDSMAYLDLTLEIIDTTIAVSGFTISSNHVGGQYQWVNCDSNYTAIVGAVSESFTPMVDGNYAAVVRSGQCVDTSACVNIQGLSLSGNTLGSKLELYPNPSKGIVTVRTPKILSIAVYSLDGKLQFKQEAFNSDEVRLDLSNGEATSYIIQVLTGEMLYTRKITMH